MLTSQFHRRYRLDTVNVELLKGRHRARCRDGLYVIFIVKFVFGLLECSWKSLGKNVMALLNKCDVMNSAVDEINLVSSDL